MDYHINWYRIALFSIFIVLTGFYSFNVKSQTAEPLTIDVLPRKASISFPGENDLYRFEITIRMEGGTFTIQTYGKMDTYMYLYRLDGTTPIPIKEDNNSGIDNNAKITVNLQAKMIYYVRLKANSPNAIGTYYINVVREPYLQPPNNLIGTGRLISVNQGSINLRWDAPWSEIPPLKYYVFKSTTETGTFSRISTTSLRHIKYTLPKGSTFWYCVRAVYPSGVSVQSKKVSVTADAPILNDDGATTNASIDTPGQEDWYRFYIPDYHLPVYLYEIKVSGTSGQMDMVAYLYESDLTTLQDKDENTNPYFGANLIGGTYVPNKWLYIKVKAYPFSSATGSYGISVLRPPLDVNPRKELLVNAPAFESMNIDGGSAGYTFKTAEAGTYTIQTHGNQKTTLALYVVKDNGLLDILEIKQDGGEGQNALISRDLTANTKYVVGFSGYLPQNVSGDYSIEVNGPIVPLVVDDPYKSDCRISLAGESEWYKFQTGAAGTYTIRQFVNCSMVLSLYESNQITLIAQDGDYMLTYQTVEQTLNPNTWYYIRLRSVGRYSCCYYYGVGVFTGPEVILTVNAAVTDAVIDGAGEMDWFGFQTGAAGTYTIQTYGSLNTYMYLYSHMWAPASPIAEDDNSGTNNNARITQNLNANTWYWVKIRGSNSSFTGPYSIDVKAP
jgi:hypothetical protein